jgi:hypothetical protein
MEGLHRGMEQGWADTARWLQTIDPSSVMNLNAASGAAFGAAAATQMSTMTNNKTVTFNGDLSFPNITNADDAEGFIKNLEALAESRS